MKRNSESNRKLGNKNIFIFLLPVLIFFFPAQNFILNNIYELPNLNIIQIIIYNICFFVLCWVTSIFLSKFIKINFVELLLKISLLFWILFNYENIRALLNDYNQNLASEFSFIIILLIFIFFLKIYNKQKKILFIFLFVFFFIQYLFSGITYFQNYVVKTENNIDSNKSKLTFNQDTINRIKTKKTENIYYVILDEMTSIKEFNNIFGVNFDKKDLISQVEKYNYFDDYSSFNLTNLTVASILNLDRIVEVGDDISKYNHNKILFPKNLSKINFATSQEPKLLKLLKDINYNFIWIGNNWGNCKNFNKDLCSNPNLSKKKNLEIVNLKLINSFLVPTPYEITLRKLNSFFKIKKNKYFLGNDFIENDAINKFLKQDFKLEQKKKYFFLIHHMMPHNPYIYNTDCTYDGSAKNNLKDQLEGYKKNYFCTIKRINEFLDFIEKNDPGAIVVLQGDHGFKNDNNFTYENDLEKFKIFNLLKTPDECKNYYKNNKRLGNINSIRVVLNCAFDLDLKLINNYPVFSNKSNKNFGVVKKINLN